MNELHPMIAYLLSQGGKSDNETWADIAERFDISPNQQNRAYRGDVAHTKWRRFLGSKRGLEFKRATIGKNGQIVSTTIGRASEPAQLPKTDGLEVKFVTTTPNGGAFVRYQQPKPGEVSRQQFREVIEELKDTPGRQLKDWTPDAKERTGQIEIIALGDVHIGMSADDAVFGLNWSPGELFRRANTLIQHVNEDAGKIILVFGGDITDGQDEMTTRRKHRLPQNLNNKEQLKTACNFALHILDGITALTDAPVRVVFLANSNHGGMLDFATGLLLETTAPNRYGGQVEVKLQESFIECYEIAGRSFLFTHGYDEKHMQKGWSRHLQPSHVQFVERFIEHRRAVDPVLVRFDQHQYHDAGQQRFRDILCPAFSNPSNWVQMNFAANSKGGFLKIEVQADGQLYVRLIEFK